MSKSPAAAAGAKGEEGSKDTPAAAAGSRLTVAVNTSVVVHPIVLLSTVDHYNRVAKDTKKRVVGVLLGTVSRNVNDGAVTVDVTNSFAVPFEEDLKKPSVYFLDHNYLETMFRMYKKVNGACAPLPAYSTHHWTRPSPAIPQSFLSSSFR